MHSQDRIWAVKAMQLLTAEANRTPDTPLRTFPLPQEWGIDLYLKDESQHPTGSLKHRLARSLLIHALVNGDIDRGYTLVEASSGSTAVSEAYFAQLLGLDFVAVVPARTSQAKIALIEHYGGRCSLVEDPQAIYAEAERLGSQSGWFYLDQFTNASVASDWRGEGSLPHSIFSQLAMERYPDPHWIVTGAGTGGTSATLGRYIRYRQKSSKVAVVDPEGSAFFRAWSENCRNVTGAGSRIEGIGRPRVEPSFVPSIIDEMIHVPDSATIAALKVLEEATGIKAGGSTGTNLVGTFQVIAQMLENGEHGSVVTLICDDGERYADTYYSDSWTREQGLETGPYLDVLREFLATSTWTELSSVSSQAALTAH